MSPSRRDAVEGTDRFTVCATFAGATEGVLSPAAKRRGDHPGGNKNNTGDVRSVLDPRPSTVWRADHPSPISTRGPTTPDIARQVDVDLLAGERVAWLAAGKRKSTSTDQIADFQLAAIARGVRDCNCKRITTENDILGSRSFLYIAAESAASFPSEKNVKDTLSSLLETHLLTEYGDDNTKINNFIL